MVQKVAPGWTPSLLALRQDLYEDEIENLVSYLPEDYSEVPKTWADKYGNVIYAAHVSRNNAEHVLAELMKQVAMLCRPDQVLSRDLIEASSEV